MREKNKEQIYCKFVINTFIYIQILNAKTKARSKKKTYALTTYDKKSLNKNHTNTK